MSAPPRARSRLLAVVVASLAAAALLSLAVSTQAAVAAGPDYQALSVGGDPYVPGHPYRGDFPDPTVLRVGARYYAYSTETAGMNVPVLTAGNLDHWRAVHRRRHASTTDALPRVPSWAWGHDDGSRRRGLVWAPSVLQVGHHFVMAYTVRKKGSAQKMCLSTASSRSARGPFVDHSKAPLLCGPHGVIDPQLYRESGQVWLLYKTEDMAAGNPDRLWIRPMAPGARTLSSTPATLLLTASTDWEVGVIEAPAMIDYKGVHYLFYSGNNWATRAYAIGYAICQGVTGPCARVVDPTEINAEGQPQSVPLLSRDADVWGPGGGTPIVGSAGGLRLAYHAWDAGSAHYPKTTACRHRTTGCAQRRLHVARLAVDPTTGYLSVADPGD